jgi:aspartyl protease family protein
MPARATPAPPNAYPTLADAGPTAAIPAKSIKTVDFINPPKPAAPADESTAATYSLTRDRLGHFTGMAQVNQQSIKILVDTGASMVVIPLPVAQRLSLKSGAAMMFKTAGGPVTHYAATIDSLRLGPIELRQIEAAINPVMQEDYILLGMNALRMMRFTQQNDALVLQGQASLDAAPPTRFKRSVKECMGADKRFDNKALACLRGE